MLEMQFHTPCNLFISGGDTSRVTSNMDYLGHQDTIVSETIKQDTIKDTDRS